MRLYRSLIKLQKKKIPEDLRAIGDAMIKQEFRLHLDSANADQMSKFIIGWKQYELMLDKQLDTSRSIKKVAEVLHSPEVDESLKDKLTQEQ